MIDAQHPTGQEVAYIRVSTKDQNLARQEALAAPCEASGGRSFKEKQSGKDRQARPQLRLAIDYCRSGDTLAVWSVDRLARSIRDRDIIAELLAKGMSVRFEKDGLSFAPGERATAAQSLQLNILGVFAEFERDISKERQAEGIAEAKKAGTYRKRKKRYALTFDQIEGARKRVGLGVAVAMVARDLGVSRPTLYKAMNDENNGLQPDIEAIDSELMGEVARVMVEAAEEYNIEVAEGATST
ncbi:recombinase family protein [Frigoribacterium sp. CFBP 8766]|uniref:recombinase family protein n=1 Tax=Frigoribacterium sp. CFBP 8766 TaxID=2775273 RepID=UPI0017802032|nr:recombinase family protein [Frigoribacterium sp. CFBP 8766]